MDIDIAEGTLDMVAESYIVEGMQEELTRFFSVEEGKGPEPEATAGNSEGSNNMEADTQENLSETVR